MHRHPRLTLCLAAVWSGHVQDVLGVSYIISTDRNWPNENWQGSRDKCTSEGYSFASLYSAADARLLKAAAQSGTVVG